MAAFGCVLDSRKSIEGCYWWQQAHMEPPEQIGLIRRSVRESGCQFTGQILQYIDSIATPRL